MIDARQASLVAGAALLVAGTVLALRPAPVPAPSPVLAPLAPPPAPVAEAPRLAGQAVAIAARDIPRGAAITAEAVSIIRMDRPPAEGVSESVDALVGRVALERIPAGQTLLPGLLTARPAEAGLAPLIPLQTRAVTLKVADDSGIAFLVRPGDRVDVMIATRSEGANRAEPPDLSRLVVQDVVVLAVGDALDSAPPPPPQANAPRREPQRNVTLAATPEQLLLLGLTRADGGYVLALRNPEDRGGIEAAPTLRPALLGEVPPPPPTVTERPAPAPRPARTGPEIIRGPVGVNR